MTFPCRLILQSQLASCSLAAAGLGAVGVAHSYLGERYSLMRFFPRIDLPHLWGSDVFTKRTLRFALHLTTVAWWGAAATLMASAPIHRDAASSVSVSHFW